MHIQNLIVGLAGLSMVNAAAIPNAQRGVTPREAKQLSRLCQIVPSLCAGPVKCEESDPSTVEARDALELDCEGEDPPPGCERKVRRDLNDISEIGARDAVVVIDCNTVPPPPICDPGVRRDLSGISKIKAWLMDWKLLPHADACRKSTPKEGRLEGIQQVEVPDAETAFMCKEGTDCNPNLEIKELKAREAEAEPMHDDDISRVETRDAEAEPQDTCESLGLPCKNTGDARRDLNEVSKNEARDNGVKKRNAYEIHSYSGHEIPDTTCWTPPQKPSFEVDDKSTTPYELYLHRFDNVQTGIKFIKPDALDEEPCPDDDCPDKVKREECIDGNCIPDKRDLRHVPQVEARRLEARNAADVDTNELCSAFPNECCNVGGIIKPC